MAAGFLSHLSGGEVEVRSAGTQPGDEVNPVVVTAMGELGIDLATQTPKVLTSDAVEASDYVVTMGCGDECPWFHGKTYLDWELDDPAGQDLDAVRAIRDAVRAQVEALLTDIRS
jgi:protein-tyrosine-phosphatase